MAREFTADRVLLSSHMKLHWDSIGFIPDNLNGEDEAEDTLGDNIQIGKSVEKAGPGLTNRYKGVIIRGFSANVKMTDILSFLENYDIIDKNHIDKDQNSGNLTISYLNSDQCLKIIEMEHRKIHLGQNSL